MNQSLSMGRFLISCGCFSKLELNVHEMKACVTGGGLLVVLDGASPLHLHHAPLDAAVVDVAEVLRVLLHALEHGVGGGGSEAALAFLKVLVVSHLNHTNHMSAVQLVCSSLAHCTNTNNLTEAFLNSKNLYLWPVSNYQTNIQEVLLQRCCAGSPWRASSQVCPGRRQLCPGPAYGSCPSTAPGGGQRTHSECLWCFKAKFIRSSHWHPQHKGLGSKRTHTQLPGHYWDVSRRN